MYHVDLLCRHFFLLILNCFSIVAAAVLLANKVYMLSLLDLLACGLWMQIAS